MPTPLTVNYSISGTATLGQDYTLSGTPGTVVIPAGQLVATVTLTALQDSVVEKRETVVLTVTGGERGKNTVKIAIAKQQGAKKNLRGR